MVSPIKVHVTIITAIERAIIVSLKHFFLLYFVPIRRKVTYIFFLSSKKKIRNDVPCLVIWE